MDTSTLKPEEMPHFWPPEKAAEAIPWADIVVSTGTTLINDTLEGLLMAARPDTDFIVVGPSASILPGPLFARGVDSVGGVLVTDADQLLIYWVKPEPDTIFTAYVPKRLPYVPEKTHDKCVRD